MSAALTVLQHLVAEARQLGGEDVCGALGHEWETEGGRPCPHEDTKRECRHSSQAVYRCARCGIYDYGEPGGPGHADCERGRE